MLLTGRLHRPKASGSLPLFFWQPCTSVSSLVLTSTSTQSLPVIAPPLPAATALGKKLRSAARARAAAKTFWHMPRRVVAFFPSAQLLPQSSVAPTTLRVNEIGVQEFETYARNHKWKLKSGSAVDEALAKYGASMYELGEDAGPLRAAVYGMALFRPDLQLPAKNLFPKAAQALKCFRRLVPSTARDPLPWLVLVLFCGLLTLSRVHHFWLPRHSCSLTLTFVLVKFYFTLKMGHVLSPVRDAGGCVSPLEACSLSYYRA